MSWSGRPGSNRGPPAPKAGSRDTRIAANPSFIGVVRPPPLADRRRFRPPVVEAVASCCKFSDFRPTAGETARTFLWVVLLWIGLAAPSMAPDGTLLVVNRSGGSISFIDLATRIEALRTDGVRHRDSRLRTVERSICDTILEIFGIASPQFHRHECFEVDTGPSIPGTRVDDLCASDELRQAQCVERISGAIARIRGLIDSLEEKRA